MFYRSAVINKIRRVPKVGLFIGLVLLTIVVLGLLFGGLWVKKEPRVEEMFFQTEAVEIFSDSFDDSDLSQWQITGASSPIPQSPTPTPPADTIIFSDNFDNLDQWQIDSPDSENSFSVSEENSVEGKAFKIEINSQKPSTLVNAYHRFDGSQQGVVEVYFYDDYPVNNGSFIAISDNNWPASPASANFVAVGIYPAVYKSTYWYRAGKGNSSNVNTGIQRSKGWHKVEFISDSQGSYAKLDGVNLGHTATGMVNFSKISLISAWAPAHKSYFDSLKVTSPSTSTPTPIPTLSPTPPPQGFSPIGWLDSADCDLFQGWAGDSDNPDESVGVQLYADGPMGTGTFLGGTIANLSKEAIVCQMLGGTNCEACLVDQPQCKHTFSFNTPESLKDGNTHKIYLYGINLQGTGGEDVLLSGSPKEINCQP